MTSLQAGEVTTSKSVVERLPAPGGSEDGESMMEKAAKDIAFGSIAGMVAEVFEYPFDLAKVRLQAQLLAPPNANVTRFDGPLHCLTQTWKEEGVRGLYRGLPAPIVGSMAETAALFVAYSSLQNLIRSCTSSSSKDASNSAPLTLSQLALAAGGAGFLASFVLTPIELVKCKMQVQMMNFHPPAAPGRIPRRSIPTVAPLLPHSSSPSSSLPRSPFTNPTRHIHDMAYKSPSIAVQTLRPPGPIALIRSIVDSYGVRGLWLGHTGTLVRETGGTAGWFVAKEWVARHLVAYRLKHAPHPQPSATVANTELLAWESAVSGALAGAFGALVFYPADTVKSAIQTEEELRPRSMMAKPRVGSRSFIGTFRQMWAKHGVKGLYAGCGMTVARAVPSSGIIFVVYDGLTSYFS